MIRSIVSAIALFLPIPATADDQLGRAIDAIFADIDQEAEPGCAAGVIHEGKYLHKAGYGRANLEYGVPITSASVFRIGSVSKQFTATAIAILALRGDLDLDADVHTYLSDLADYGQPVTVRQMVHHIAGMGDYDHEALRNPDGSEFRFGNEDYSTIEEFYARVAGANLVHDAGTRYQYSNLGYFLLAHVVERVSGKTLAQFAEEEIFSPLGMRASLFNDNVNQVIPNRAYGYRKTGDGNWETYMTNLDYVGDGGVFTSLDDFIAWDWNFYDNRLGNGGPDLIELIQTPHPGTVALTDAGPRNVNYAFGMTVGERDGHRMISHTGGWVAFTALYSRFPGLQLSVVVFCNSTRVNAPERGRTVIDAALAAIAGR